MRTIERHGPAYRVLVELAGQDRPMALRELFEATGVEPETLHVVMDNLALNYYVRATDFLDGMWSIAPVFTITWEGQEALRRTDAEATLRMRKADLPQPTAKKRWWRR